MTIGLSYVAFVDILGFGDMVISDCESATPGEKYLPKLKSAIHTALGHAEAVDAKIIQFSDSIVIASPFKPDPEAFCDFLKLVRDFQSILFKSGILCRGGTSHGRHFHDEAILFSQGLIEAYRIESQVALNPRVVISPETVELISPGGVKVSGVLIDSDGESFLDFLNGINRDEVEQALSHFRPSLNAQDSRVRAKIAWLFRYANFKYSEIPLPREITIRELA